MSDFGDVPAAILAVVNGAVTLGGYRDGFIAYTKLAPDQFPYAMVHSPVKKLDRGEFQHGVETTSNQLWVVWKDTAIADVNDQVILIEAALDGSTLTVNIVEDTWVSEVTRQQSVDSDFTGAIFTVETRVNV